MLPKPALASDSLFASQFPQNAEHDQLDAQIQHELKQVATRLGLSPDEVARLLTKAYTSATVTTDNSHLFANVFFNPTATSNPNSNSERLTVYQTRDNFRTELRQAVQAYSYSVVKPLEGNLVTYLPSRITRTSISGYVLFRGTTPTNTQVQAQFAIVANLPNEEQTPGDSYIVGSPVRVYLSRLSRNPLFICSQPLPALKESNPANQPHSPKAATDAASSLPSGIRQLYGLRLRISRTKPQFITAQLRELLPLSLTEGIDIRCVERQPGVRSVVTISGNGTRQHKTGRLTKLFTTYTEQLQEFMGKEQLVVNFL